MTDEELLQYPHLWESINTTGEFIQVPRNEWFSIRGFFGDSYEYISYEGKYYYVRLFGADL